MFQEYQDTSFSSAIEGLASGASGGAIAGSAIPGIGTLIGGGLGVISKLGGLIGRGPTNTVKQSADINKIADNNRVTPAHAAAVVAWHANHSSDNFNDLAAYVAGTNSRFSSLLDEYNAGNPQDRIAVGELDTINEYQEVPTNSPVKYQPVQSQIEGQIQTMSPVRSPVLSQIDPMAYRNVVASGTTGLTNQSNWPPLATPGIISQPVQYNTTPTTAAATPSNTTTYALIGGGAALLLLVAVLLLKK